MQHRTVDIEGPVHYVDFGGAGRPIVLVHGLGGSHVNWFAVGPRLARHGRVYAVDLIGHGLTRSLGRSARVGSNRRMLGRFLDLVAREPAVLMGNSMGGYLSIAEAAEEPAKVASLVLVNAAVPLAPGAHFDPAVTAVFFAMATPVLGGALMLRRHLRGPEQTVRDILNLCCVDPSRVSREVYDAHIALARERAVHGRINARDFLAAQRSLMMRLMRRRKFYAMVGKVHANTLIVQGNRDRLVRIEATRMLAAARPDWRLEVLEDIGHVPQIEAPDRFLAVVEPWLEARAAAA